MPSQPPLPPLLAPYLSAQPEASLTLVSSILGATSNWLTLRFLHASLSTSSNLNASLGLGESHNGSKKVVLVSFLRGWEFWRAEAKRLGLDLARLADKKQFAFVDGLSELFSAPQTVNAMPSVPSIASGPTRTSLPFRSQPGAVPGRGPPSAAPALAMNNDNLARSQTEQGIVKKLHFSGRGIAALDALERDIASVIQLQKSSMEDGEELLLIIDQPDFLLAATGPVMGIGATEMAEWVSGLQQHVHATIVTLAADSPLIHNASTSGHQMATPVESEHAAFAISLAHRARSVMQLRTLETGAARDVSGVLRISRGGGADDSVEERELLYYIQRDGGLSVFGRGES
ncbi:hypothetical protein N7448_010588 [Penicillium atrosanguineum]|uniref:Elongator complex protein 6 n=1 Tax=Penicillium atrosanguineum TaxID=1132637 RepID=A0A9W9KU77_9EURO|nr:uncharacterized protein N7443_007811 [Penicillium atrosanguineum]KAJ5118881.1 hypothetical protein N7526_010518 [Penicillium atrosanguineum]KAJ5119919.1 hypothetical protein N7448_010588 [Penicillium atrosanguineum]KAJ5296918.1 hypothetical protein N7443_007811 [Penicillium atrosanguineum]KAJ5299679.1 hypothetical protein N7476_011236 [Penicillium atrosanguineum]